MTCIVRMVIQAVPGLMSFDQKRRVTSMKSLVLSKKDDMASLCYLGGGSGAVAHMMYDSVSTSYVC